MEKHHNSYVVSGGSGAWMTQCRARFMYDGWNLMEELRVPTSGDPTLLRQYTWGLDLSGQNGDASVFGLHGAGGIGGLLAVYDTNNTTTTRDDRSYAYLYDANGNVGQLVEWSSGAGGAAGTAWASGRLVAKYEYDPYGNIVGPDADGDGNIAEEAGPYAAVNPFRFSTKFLDPETGLYYYGHRYYSPRLGRWISRDPMEEEGGANLLRFLRNSPADDVDPDGRWTWSCIACAAALGGKVGGSAAGCLWGCLESSRTDYSLGECWLDCMAAFYTPEELLRQFGQNPAEWIGAGACAKCGFDIIAKLVARNALKLECVAAYKSYKIACSVPGCANRPPVTCENATYQLAMASTCASLRTFVKLWCRGIIFSEPDAAHDREIAIALKKVTDCTFDVARLCGCGR